MGRFTGERNTIKYTLTRETKRGKTKEKEVKIRLYGNRSLVQKQRDLIAGELPVVVFAGYGNGRRVQKLTAQTLAEDGIYAQAVHFPSISRRWKDSLKPIMIDMAQVAAAKIRGESARTLTTFAHSKGAGIFALAISSDKYPNSALRDAFLLQGPQPPIIYKPEGIPTTREAKQAEERALQTARRAYGRRMMSNWGAPMFERNLSTTYDNVRTLVDAGARIAYDFVTGRLKPQLNLAVTHDFLGTIFDYTQTSGAKVVLGFADGDKISPATAAQAIFDARRPVYDGTNPRIVVGKGVHTTLHLRQGREILRESLKEDFPRVRRAQR